VRPLPPRDARDEDKSIYRLKHISSSASFMLENADPTGVYSGAC